MKNYISLGLLLALILITGCGQKKTENTSSGDNRSSVNSTEEKKESDVLVMGPKKFMKSYKNCNPSDTCTYFKLSYLEATSGKIKDKLNAFIQKQILLVASIGDSTPVSIQAAADTFMVTYVDTKKEFPDMPGAWFWEYNMTVYNETPKILTISAENFTFMGGAHPNSFAGYYNINKETGDTLSLKELLSPGFETRLNSLIDKKYREMKGLGPKDNLQDKGDLFENKITFTYNAGVTKEGGLEFYYNPYEIAAYAVGPITVTLTKAELADLIGPNSPLK